MVNSIGFGSNLA